MSFKAKALGLVSAGILSLSVFTGAALADGNNGVQVVLSPSGHTCETSVTAATVDFGGYTYNASTGQYDYTVGAGNTTFDYSLGGPSGPDQVCAVNIAAGNLVGANLGGVIPVSNLGVSGANLTSGQAGTATFNTSFAFTGGWQSLVANANLAFAENLQVAFASAPIATMAPDTYTSTIYIQSSMGAP